MENNINVIDKFLNDIENGIKDIESIIEKNENDFIELYSQFVRVKTLRIMIDTSRKYKKDMSGDILEKFRRISYSVEAAEIKIKSKLNFDPFQTTNIGIRLILESFMATIGLISDNIRNIKDIRNLKKVIDMVCSSIKIAIMDKTTDESLLKLCDSFLRDCNNIIKLCDMNIIVEDQVNKTKMGWKRDNSLCRDYTIEKIE